MLKKCIAALCLAGWMSAGLTAPRDDAISALNRGEYGEATDVLRNLGQAGDPVA